MKNTVYKFEDHLYLYDGGDDMSMGDQALPTPDDRKGWPLFNADKAPVDWDGATIAGHQSPGWLTATIVIGTIAAVSLAGGWAFLWICGRMLRSVGV